MFLTSHQYGSRQISLGKQEIWKETNLLEMENSTGLGPKLKIEGTGGPAFKGAWNFLLSIY